MNEIRARELSELSEPSEVMVVHGFEVVIARVETVCGGKYAWFRRDGDDWWRQAGCICHNPAVGP